MRADAANAKLQVDKLTKNEKDMKRHIKELEANENEWEHELEVTKKQLNDLEDIWQKLYEGKETKLKIANRNWKRNPTKSKF